VCWIDVKRVSFLSGFVVLDLYFHSLFEFGASSCTGTEHIHLRYIFMEYCVAHTSLE